MIVRTPISCLTCNKVHTLRIGMGQGTSQSHKFHCMGCNEEIKVGMTIDYINTRHKVVCEDNCELADWDHASPIINLDADFLVPKSMINQDMSFHRIQQMQRMFENSKPDKAFQIDSLGPIFLHYSVGENLEFYRPFKKSWSLLRNGNRKLSQERIVEENKTTFKESPISDVGEWGVRLARKMIYPAFTGKFNTIMQEFSKIDNTPEFQKMISHFSLASKKRSDTYFKLFSSFFESYSEFAQVFVYAKQGETVLNDMLASSTNFNKVKSFYGDTYEAFAILTDYFAFANNISSGRNFDQFSQLTLDQYRKLDRANMLKPFASNNAIFDACSEFNPSLRNASHHGSFSFNAASQIITYNTGKGSQGPQLSLSYAEYLIKCVNIMFQVILLFEVEITISKKFNKNPPII